MTVTVIRQNKEDAVHLQSLQVQLQRKKYTYVAALCLMQTPALKVNLEAILEEYLFIDFPSNFCTNELLQELFSMCRRLYILFLIVNRSRSWPLSLGDMQLPMSKIRYLQNW